MAMHLSRHAGASPRHGPSPNSFAPGNGFHPRVKHVASILAALSRILSRGEAAVFLANARAQHPINAKGIRLSAHQEVTITEDGVVSSQDANLHDSMSHLQTVIPNAVAQILWTSAPSVVRTVRRAPFPHQERPRGKN